MQESDDQPTTHVAVDEVANPESANNAGRETAK